MTEVIRPGTYRLKDDNGNVLTNTWNSEHLRRFFPLKFSLTIVYLTFAPIKAPRPEYFRPGSLRGSTRVHYHLSFRLLSYGNTPSYLNKRVVRSFNLPYVALL